MHLRETAKFSVFHIAKCFCRKCEKYKVSLAEPLVEIWFPKRCKVGTPSSMLGDALISLPTCGGRSTWLVEMTVSWNLGWVWNAQIWSRCCLCVWGATTLYSQFMGYIIQKSIWDIPWMQHIKLKDICSWNTHVYDFLCVKTKQLSERVVVFKNNSTTDILSQNKLLPTSGNTVNISYC